MKKYLIPSTLLLFGNEIISLAVVCVLLFMGLAWFVAAAAEGY